LLAIVQKTPNSRFASFIHFLFLKLTLLNQIAVTTEFETEQSQIELQARPDSHSEIDDDKSP